MHWSYCSLALNHRCIFCADSSVCFHPSDGLTWAVSCCVTLNTTLSWQLSPPPCRYRPRTSWLLRMPLPPTTPCDGLVWPWRWGTPSVNNILTFTTLTGIRRWRASHGNSLYTRQLRQLPACTRRGFPNIRSDVGAYRCSAGNHFILLMNLSYYQSATLVMLNLLEEA